MVERDRYIPWTLDGIHHALWSYATDDMIAAQDMTGVKISTAEPHAEDEPVPNPILRAFIDWIPTCERGREAGTDMKLAVRFGAFVAGWAAARRCVACAHAHLHAERCGEHVYPIPDGTPGEDVCACRGSGDPRWPWSGSMAPTRTLDEFRAEARRAAAAWRPR
jgi:hypothetical protein